MGSVVACGGTTQVVAPTPEEGHNEESHDDHDEGDAERQFLINTLLDIGPGDPPEVVECVVDLIVDLSGLSYIEIEPALGLIASELDPILKAKDSGKTVVQLATRGPALGIQLRIYMII